MSVKKGQDALLLWCQRNTEGYQGVHVTNFHTSWADGLAFCAIIHKHRPDRIQFDQLSKDNRAHNLGLAFKVAEELGIPPLLDVEDIINIPKPEPLSIITYLSQYYHYFNKKRSSVTLDAEQDKKQKTNENTNQNPTPQQEPDKIPDTAEEHGMCAKCGLELEGPVIEVVGKAYHEHCFGCYGCGKALLGKCLNVDSNPYCESCGKKAFVESKLKKQRTIQHQSPAEPAKEAPKEPAKEPATETESSSSSTSSGNKAARWGGVALFGIAKPQESQTTEQAQEPASTPEQPKEVPKEQPQQPPQLPPKKPVVEPVQEAPKEPAKESTPQTSETKPSQPVAPPKPGRPSAPIPKKTVPDDDEDAPPSKPPPRPAPSKSTTQEAPKEPSKESTPQPEHTSTSEPPPLPRKPTVKPPLPSKPANAAQLVASAQSTTAPAQEPKKEKPALPVKPASSTNLLKEQEQNVPPDDSKRGSAIDYKKPLPVPSKKTKTEMDEDAEDAPEAQVRLSYRQSKAIRPEQLQAEAKKAAAESQSAFATFPNLEGYLEKKGDVGVIKSWKRRYFKLRGDRMFYYTDDVQKDKDEPLGYIPLKDAKSIDPTPRMKGAFQIHTENPTRIWYLKADTDEEMQKWIRGCTIHSHYDSSTVPHKTAPTSQNTLLSLKLLSQPKEGYLSKLKGGFSHTIMTLSKGSLWSPRYFVVKDGILFKYTTLEDVAGGKPASKLPLYKCTLEEYQDEAEEQGSSHVFQITTTKGTIVLKAADEEDMHRWLNAIRKQQIMMDQIINDIEA